MTIAYQNSGASDTGTNSLSVPYPSSISAGDLLLLKVASKGGTDQTIPPDLITGWELIGRRNGGAGTAGADSGTVWVSVYSKLATGSESGSLTVTTAGDANGSMVGIMDRWTYDTSKHVQVSMVSGTDTTGSSTAFSAACSPSVDFNGTDIALAVFATNTDGTTAFTAQQISATGGSGSTLSGGSITDMGTIVASDGHDVGLDSFYATTTGWSGTRTVTVAATGTNSSANTQTGAALLLRMREINIDVPSFKSFVGVNANSVTATTGVSAGDLLVMTVQGKYTSVSTPSGWTDRGTTSGGAGSDGLDTGTVRVSTFTKVADGTENGATFTPSITGEDSVSMTFCCIGKAIGSGTWEPEFASISDNSGGGTTFGGTSGTSHSFNVNDIVAAISAANTDAYSYSGHTFSATGITFAAATELVDNAQTAGNDHRRIMAISQVTAGYDNAQPVTYTATASGSATNVPAGAITVVKARVNLPAKIDTQPTNETANSGATAIFSVVASGTDVQYQWQEGIVATDADFQFANASGTTLETIDSKWDMASTSLETNGSGQLQAVAGSVWVDVTARYADSQPDTQFFEMVIKAGGFGSGQYRRGYLQHDGVNEGYRFEISSTNASISRDGSYANAAAHGIDPTAADYTLRGEYNHTTGVVRLLLNGSEVVTYTDGTPLTGGCPALGLYAAGTPSNSQIESFKCTSSTGNTTWEDITGETASDFETPTLTMDDDGNQYRVRVYNDYASVTSSTVTLTVEEGGITGTLGATESGADTAEAEGTVLVEGTAEVEEDTAEDTASMSGDVIVQGDLGAEETGEDTAAMTGLTVVEGTADITESSASDLTTPDYGFYGQVDTANGYSPTARIVGEALSSGAPEAAGTFNVVINGSAGQTVLLVFGVAAASLPSFTMPAGWSLIAESALVDDIYSAAYTAKLEANTSSINVESDVAAEVVSSCYLLEKVSNISHAVYQAASGSHSTILQPEVDTDMGVQNYTHIAAFVAKETASSDPIETNLTGKPAGYYEVQKYEYPSTQSVSFAAARKYEAGSAEVQNPSDGFSLSSEPTPTYVSWTFAVTPEILGSDVELVESGADTADFQGVIQEEITGSADFEETGSDTAVFTGAGIVQGDLTAAESGADTPSVYGQVYTDIGLAPTPTLQLENADRIIGSNTSFDIPISTDPSRRSLLFVAGGNVSDDAVFTMPSPWVKVGQTTRYGASNGITSAVFYNPESLGSDTEVTVTSSLLVSLAYVEYSFDPGCKVSGTGGGRNVGLAAPNPPSHTTGYGAQNAAWIEFFAGKPNVADGISAPSPGYTDGVATPTHPDSTGANLYAAQRYLNHVESEDPAAVSGWSNSGPAPYSWWTVSVVPGISGEADVSETGGDTAVFVGGSVLFGTIDLVEAGSDTVNIAGGVVSTGDLDATEDGPDVAAITGGVVISATADLTESGSDEFDATGGVQVQGDFDASEVGADTAAATGDVIVAGDLDAVEPEADTANISGGNRIQGYLLVDESGADTLTATGTLLVEGTADLNEPAGDTASFAGEVFVEGDINTEEEGSDLATILGANMLQGYILAEETGADTAASSGVVLVEGDLAAVEQFGDTASVSGASVIGGTFDAVEQGADTAAMAGDVVVSGDLDATDGNDVAVVTGQIIVRGSAVLAESGADTAEMLGIVVTGAVLNAVEQGPDTATMDGNVLVQGTMAATDSQDNVAIYGDVLVNGGADLAEVGSDTASATGAVFWAGSMAASEEGQDTFTATGIVVTDGSLNAVESGQDTAELTGIVFWTPLEGTANAVETGSDDATFIGESVVYTLPRSWLVQPEDRSFEINAENRSFTIKP